MPRSRAISNYENRQRKEMRLFTSKSNSAFILFIIVVLACGATAERLSRIRQKRAERKKTSEYHNVMNRGATVDCFDAIKECRNHKECRSAIRSLRNTCKVDFGRCNAKMIDLPRCGQIMDDLHKYSFPKARCRCTRDLKRCFDVLNDVYANPCFDQAMKMRERAEKKTITTIVKNDTGFVNSVKKTTSLGPLPTPSSFTFTSMVSKRVDTISGEYKTSIIHLRQRGMFPGNLSAIHKVEDPSNSGVGKNAPTKTLEADYEDSIESIFGDEGFAEPPPPAKPNTRIDSSEDRPNPKVNIDEVLKPHLFSVSSSKPTTFTVKTVADRINYTTANSEKTEIYTRGQRVSYKLEDMEKELREANANFKIMAIVLGAILGTLILTAMIGFAWSRSRGGVFYTGGKLVQRPNGDASTQVPIHNQKSDEIKQRTS